MKVKNSNNNLWCLDIVPETEFEKSTLSNCLYPGAALDHHDDGTPFIRIRRVNMGRAAIRIATLGI